MRAGILFSLMLAGCDDDIFGTGGGSSDTAGYGTGYDGAVAIFDDTCLSCHSAGAKSGDLDLETDPCAALVGVASAGADYGGAPLVVPGDSASSVLWNKMANTGTYGGVMPLGSGLDQATVDIVKNWIDDGAACGDTATP